ncbi:MAG: hypothetical protein JW699_08585 [Chitinispirillaceae bacterium]|nr:hypothetical protein [Chitinispirillaceae bacterium]
MAIALFLYASASGGPIVLNGAMLPDFIGAPLSGLRVIDGCGIGIPFQVDEKTVDGEYICPEGRRPNTELANGRLDPQDEIVFLWEDADSCGTGEDTCDTIAEDSADGGAEPVTMAQGPVKRRAWVVIDSSIPLSAVSYCSYDHSFEYLRTPYYYAQFAPNRFHFTRAGVMDFESREYVHLTKELRVEMIFKILWGLIPVRYTEESIVCRVKRYKTGPVRLIRRGDLYINLGFGIKTSKAVVYQMCYPDVVKVPVTVHVPVRFKSVCSDAYIEMTPVIRSEVAERNFRFIVPDAGYTCNLSSGRARMDTLIRVSPDRGYVISDGRQGYGWITRVGVDDSLLAGSGYIMRRPSKRSGMAECGLKLTVRDLPKGNYDVVNWVLFPQRPLGEECRELLSMLNPASIMTTTGTFSNFLFCQKTPDGSPEKFYRLKQE